MDMQSQMTRPYVHDQADEPIRVHHPEEEEHEEKGATKVLKKVKEKAKKIKNSLTKHGHGHEHDHDVEIEDDENDEQDPQLHGAPVYNTQGGVTSEPVSLRHPGNANVPAPEEIVPPGTQVFPVVPSDDTKPVEPEPLQDTLYRHEAASNLMDISDSGERRDAPSHPLRVFDMSEREDQTPMNTSLLSATEDVTGTFAPGEDEYLGGGQRVEVDIERPKGLEEDPAGPEGGSSYLSGVSNYQSKVTDPTREGGGEAGVPEIVESLGRMKVTGFESDFPTRSHEFGLKNESDQTEKDIPARSDDVKVERDEEAHESKPSTYTEKIGSATSFVTDKAIAAKNTFASKLGYSEQHTSSTGDEATPRSATGYGQKVAGTVADKLTPVYERVKETGSTVMAKLPLSGGGSGAEENKGVEGKGVLTRDYLAEKLRPGEDDKALAEVIAEKLGGENKRTSTTKEVEVTVEKIPTDQIVEEKEHGEAVVAEEGKVGGGGMVGKLKGAVSSWLGGTTEEVKPKSSDSVDQSSQSLGTTVGTMGFSDSSGGALTGQRGLQDSGN
ncbi:Low-temperature-induced 65 kDa protein [Raphanus sativus]|uniref:Low-temperature-induced 65 kDa protein-like n=1 Tax=Raphanus sativus TaxID=3726 RepID=A0A6J0MFD6_RAPSA|nr:low-temperature-induced 65 kDa protein-like [Raphanus sativus]KAJ4911483.1 Low-temperature-induced 65 kDa protein [Raphanus sativus]